MIRIFKVLVPASVLILFLVEALLIFASYGTVDYLQSGGELLLMDEAVWPQIGLATGIILFGLYFSRLYDTPRIRIVVFLQQLAAVIGMTFLVQAMLSYWSLTWALSRGLLLWGSALTILTLLLGRLLFRQAMHNEVGVRRVLFVGLSPTAVHLAHYFSSHPEFGLTPVGPMGHSLNHPATREFPAGEVALPVSVAALPSLMDAYGPDWIVIGSQDAIPPSEMEDFIGLRFSGIHTEQAASLYEKILGRVCAPEIRPAELIFRDTLQPSPVNLTLQTFYASAIALVTLVILLPVFVVIAILVKVSSTGPVLLRESRIGMNSSLFTMYQFRWSGNHGESTRIGEFLHYFGLDRLPQFWNVLRGEMSIVGPYPDRPDFAAELNQAIPFHPQRTLVRPGMTGWAQIHEANGEVPHDALRRLEYDLYYVKNLSPSLDFSVLLRWLSGVLALGR